ncbi:hypothetical protein AXX17_AT3G33260 [Arabidopsis thaliana]|uniref:Uncharacterized protein n=1 Tax=Arabidopsis thaliana TaxID=3702 RepID=A0A178VBH4_ARATH|nr:hypothetical protein AXX17_AT3G33260 [Arabidopsis thaliana]
MENDGASTVCPLDLGNQIFLSGDGFEPDGVLFSHAAFHFPPKDKKEACVARIPTKLRIYLHARGQVSGPVNAPVKVIPSDSEEDDEEEDSNHWKRVKNEPEVDDKNEASSSNADPAMKEPVLEPLP